MGKATNNGKTIYIRKGETKDDAAKRYEKKSVEKQYSDFLSTMTKLNSAKAEKTLNKSWNFGKELKNIHTEKELIETAISKGYKVEPTITVSKKVETYRFGSVAEQWKFAQKEESLKERDYSDFVKGTLNTPLTKYLRKKDKFALTGTRFAKTEYEVSGYAPSLSMPISKTAYKYYEFLKSKK